MPDIPTLRAPNVTRGREEPAPVFGRSEQRGEARARIDAWDAPPIDGSGTVDERNRLEIADDRVVLDECRHAFLVSVDD